MTPPLCHRERAHIYLDDPHLRCRVKIAAAVQDLSGSEYCLLAIKSQRAWEGITG
jgi:hypothetical protein